MEAQPLISFVIPVFNVPTEMLHECIESILQLSLRVSEREIIIVDDGSADSPIGELADIIDDIVYVRQKNNGVSAARNRGLKMASGQFVQFIDGDDTLVRHAYEHILDKLRYTNTDVVLFDFTSSPEKAPLLYEDQDTLTGSELLRKENIHGSACCYAFKRSILGSLRFTNGIAYGEDEEFTAQLLIRAESVCKTSAQAYFYRPRNNSATGASSGIRQKLRRLNDTKAVLTRLNNLTDTLPTAERIALQRRIAQLTMDYIYNVIVLTRNRHYLNRRLLELEKAGLFPLPDRHYTKKYTWFRKMTNSSLGLSVLLRTLPLFKRER